MPNAPAAEAAIAFARESPDISFGVHLTFVGDGSERPVAPASEVPDLADAPGKAATDEPDQTARSARPTLRAADRARDRSPGRLAASQRRWRSRTSTRTGTCTSTGRSAKRSGRCCRLSASRVFATSRTSTSAGLCISPTVVLGRRWRADLMSRFTTTDHFYMPTSAGDTSWTALLERALSGSTLEIGAHPGELEDWRRAESRGVGGVRVRRSRRRASAGALVGDLTQQPRLRRIRSSSVDSHSRSRRPGHMSCS